jgi:hypothetical protein
MKKTKFLATGAFAFVIGAGLFPALSQAGELVSKDEISKSINQLFKEQKDLGFFEANSSIDVQIIKPQKITNPSTKKTSFTNPDLTETHAQIIENACKVTLSFSDKGDTLQLAANNEILKQTKLLDPRQKEIMRELVALHEGFHCELANIENPIVMKGKPADFNEKLNYYLKDSQSAIDNLGLMSYMGTLNETFADISAFGALLKKYGKDDPDLQRVLLVFKTQRHANYLETESDIHFTHIALNSIMNPDIQEKLINIKDGKEYKQYMLEIANESVQKLIAQNGGVSLQVLGDTTLNASVMFHLSQKLVLASLSETKRKEIVNDNPIQFRAGNMKPGFAEDLALEILKNGKQEIKTISSIMNNPKLNDEQKGEQLEEILGETIMGLYTKNMTRVFATKESKGFAKTMDDFRKSITSTYKDPVDDLDNISKRFIMKNDSPTKDIVAISYKDKVTSKDAVLSRMEVLKNRFLIADNNIKNDNKKTR